MTNLMNIPWLRQQCLGASLFSQEILQWIDQHNLWNLWVPKSHGGEEATLTEGLMKLKQLAKIDGSLGWTVTLCSGANYFIGNLQSEVADMVFDKRKSPILGGSGGAFGTAEKTGDHYVLSGTWRYATGAPYLTHFTLNAKITEAGSPVKDKTGQDKILSFVLPKEKVKIIDDWDAMGLQPTATCSFAVADVRVHKSHAFCYDHFYLNAPIFKVPFTVFADLTLWVNYLGMAEHYYEEAKKTATADVLTDLKCILAETQDVLIDFSTAIEDSINTAKASKIEAKNIHAEAVSAIPKISRQILRIHPLLGMKAARQSHQLNQIFRDYFTATQHHIFVNR